MVIKLLTKHEKGKELMATEVINAKYGVKGEDGKPVLNEEGKPKYVIINANYDFGDTLADLIEKCSDEVVRTNAISNMRVTLQSRIRSLHKQGMTPDAIQAEVDKWVPGVAASKVAVDPIAATLSQFANWPKDKQKAFLKKLQG